MRPKRPTSPLAVLIISLVLVGVGPLASLNIFPLAAASTANGAAPEAGPTTENALLAEQEIARAIRENDADGIERLLADDWAVIDTSGRIAEGKSIFSDAIKSGYLTRKTFELSEPRVRLFGDVAVVTSKVKTSGMFQGKPFDVTERQTDVLHWEHGSWKSVSTHETKTSS